MAKEKTRDAQILAFPPQRGRKRGPHPVDVYVGKRIRARRMQLNVSQEVLADSLGVTFQQVQKYEKGTNRVSASRLALIAHALAVEVAYFFESAPPVLGVAAKKSDAAPLLVADVLGTSEGLDLNIAFRAITSKPMRSHVLRLVQEAAGVSKRKSNRGRRSKADAKKQRA